jgi:prevent-host-death family protein
MDEPCSYSTYEAKARFSEVLRLVREGRTVTVTYHGKPVAEIRPLDRATGTEARIDFMRRRGLLSVPEAVDLAPEPLASRPGALARFLEERHG